MTDVSVLSDDGLPTGASGAGAVAGPGFGIWGLRLVVVVAGMTTMATEMSASRLLQPFYGSSVIVWANVIGLILIYLSLGYWWGGKVADRHPHVRGLCTVTLVAASTIALVPFVSRPVLQLTSEGFDATSSTTVIGSFIGCLLLLSVPITLLGMVPPYAVRLAIRDVGSSGSVAGSLYSLSTLGSIVGTFGSVLVMIPLIGTRRTFLAFAMALAVLSLVGLRGNGRWLAAGGSALAGMCVLVALPAGVVKAAPGSTVLFERESPYQFVQVVENPDGVRFLQLNEGWAVHSAYDPERVLTGNIWDHFLVLPSLRGSRAAAGERVLVVGNAAGSLARIYRTYRPAMRVDGVEIDPVVSDVGSRYFDMDGENLTVHQADGRPFLAASEDSWDVIVIDAYRQPYIPFYLTTVEFFELVSDHVRDGGVVAINVGSAPGDERIQRAIGATMLDVFPSVFRYRAEPYNELIVALPNRTSLDEARDRIRSAELARHRDLDSLFAAFADGMMAMRTTERALTDDRAPVEWLTDTMIIDEAARR